MTAPVTRFALQPAVVDWWVEEHSDALLVCARNEQRAMSLAAEMSAYVNGGDASDIDGELLP